MRPIRLVLKGKLLIKLLIESNEVLITVLNNSLVNYYFVEDKFSHCGILTFQNPNTIES